MKWYIVVNPQAGGGAAGRRWPGARQLLMETGIRFTEEFTSGPDKTRALVAEAVRKGSEGIAVYGGDGTISDAASVLAGTPDGPVLAVLPSGSGNDWARSIGFESPSVEASIGAIQKGSFRRVDTAVARWNGEVRFFLNSSGTGFDALVLRRALRLRSFLPLNRTCYMASLAFSALLPPVWQAEFSCDGRVFHSGGYLTFTAGVGCYSGGGMRLSPSARPDDGFIDGLCLTPMRFPSIAGNLGRVFDGTLEGTRWARVDRGSSFTVRPLAGSEMLLELDGEPVQLPVDFSALEFVSVPESLTAAVP